MNDKRKAESISEARRAIARRIARFCTSLSPQEFERLLDRMAQIHWKYDVLPHLDFLIEDGEDTEEYPETN
ncbi:MAG TPA: hypothetical protein VK648_10635 [Gemmatimonadaceae bacterium]|nr:hypothetical protein [Gemmatimonadaceae bacterium]